MNDKYKRLYLIGIDSAPLWILRKIYKRHDMKGFERFFKDGIIENLESTLPPITPVAWPSLYTGLEPHEHGIMNFFSMNKDYTRKLEYYDAGKSPPFWDNLSDVGIRSLLITPATVVNLSKRKNIDLITGFPLPPKFSSNGLEEAAKRFNFSGEPEVEQQLRKGKKGLKEISGIYEESIRRRSELSKHLIQKNEYGLIFVCFTETDRIQHYSLSRHDWEEYVVPLYKSISNFIEWIFKYENKRGGEYAIMMVSDHGAQQINNKFLLNSWLINKGYARLEESNYGGKHENQDAEPEALRFICASAEDISIDSRKRALDMKNTYAFAHLTNNPVGNIWINDSRFSNSLISEAEKEGKKREIIKALNGIRSKEGKKLIKRVYDGKEYYKGTELFIAPDIIVEVKEGYTIDVSSYSDGDLFVEPESARSGDHTRYGIFGFYSKEYTVDAKNLSVTDIASMVLKFYGLDTGGKTRLLRKGPK